MSPKNVKEFHPEYVFHIPAGQEIKFTENGKGGEGHTYFKSQNEAIVIKAPKQPPSVWALKTKNFSEGAFLTINNEGASTSLHILEMKSRVRLDDLEKALTQLKAAYLASLGIAGILRLPAPKTANFYIAYSEIAFQESSIAYIKTPVGGRPPRALAAWLSSCIEMPDGTTIKILKGERRQGDFDFGVV